MLGFFQLIIHYDYLINVTTSKALKSLNSEQGYEVDSSTFHRNFSVLWGTEISVPHSTENFCKKYGHKMILIKKTLAMLFSTLKMRDQPLR